MKTNWEFLALALAMASSTNAYWLMGVEDFITTERLDPVVNPGKVSGHVHSVLGGSNFRATTSTAQLRDSDCTSIPIPQDKSAYWFPHLYFQWKNGSFTSLDGGAVIDTPGTTTAFPDDFRMLSGDPTLRTYDPTSHAQQAVTFLCLNFNGQSLRYNSLPPTPCPDGIRAQINFPSCWDGKNTDSPDHKSHVAFLSNGADSGTCSDPKFPVTLPRIFMEVYWGSTTFDSARSQAMNSTQPFVYSHGDPTGYGYHADFINGWQSGVLQKAVDNCHCNQFGDATCCAQAGIFDLNQGKNCRITRATNEQTTGTLPKLPGNNPVQPEGQKATMFADANPPSWVSPIFAYTGSTPTATGTVVGPGSMATTPASSSSTVASNTTPTTSSTAVLTTSSAHTTSSSTHTTMTSSTVHTTSSSTIHVPTPSFPSISIPSISVPTFTFHYAATPASAAPAVNTPNPQLNAAGGTAAAPAAAATGKASSASTSGGTCSKRSQSRRSQLDRHRRNHWHQAPHVRHLEYDYST